MVLLLLNRLSFANSITDRQIYIFTVLKKD